MSLDYWSTRLDTYDFDSIRGPWNLCKWRLCNPARRHGLYCGESRKQETRPAIRKIADWCYAALHRDPSERAQQCRFSCSEYWPDAKPLPDFWEQMKTTRPFRFDWPPETNNNG